MDLPATMVTDSAYALDHLMVPRAHQLEGCAAILDARRRGMPGFLLGDLTGLGKTLSTWLAVLEMQEQDILIVCPKGAIAEWRRTIRRSAKKDKRVTIINYERTKSLMTPHATTKARSVRGKNKDIAKNGELKRTWPIVIFDESHRLRNPTSQMSLVCQKLANSSQFPIYLSATAGQKPFELSYLGRLLGHAVGATIASIDDFRQLMKRLKIGKARGRFNNWMWERNARDEAVIASLLYTGPRAIGVRRRPENIAGWPKVQRELAPVSLDAASRKLYQESWRSFRKELGLAGGSTRTPSGRVAELRFRQKTSMLRAPGTIERVAALCENDEQVAISVAFLETSAAMIASLNAQGFRTGAINGTQSAAENERQRVAFQSGALDAIVFTVTESISLHQGELAGGDRRRSLVVHDPRHSAIEMKQIEGRCHRDGQQALIYYAYADDTVDERIAVRTMNRMAAMDSMAGDDVDDLDALIAEIDADPHVAA